MASLVARASASLSAFDGSRWGAGPATSARASVTPFGDGALPSVRPFVDGALATATPFGDGASATVLPFGDGVLATVPPFADGAGCAGAGRSAASTSCSNGDGS